MQTAQIVNLVSIIFIKWEGGPLSRLEIRNIVKSYSIGERNANHVVSEGVCNMKVTCELGYGYNRQ